MAIIQSSQWKKALRNLRWEEDKMITPFRLLVKRMPDVTNKVLEKCIDFNKDKDIKSKDLKITFDFEFIDDTYTSVLWADGKKNCPESVGNK